MSLIKSFLNSLYGQFLIGGFTVSGITYFSNHIKNIALASVIAGVPIGLPSTVFVNDDKVSSYASHLLFMTGVLFMVTLLFWVLHNKYGYNKYHGIAIAMGTWVVIALLFAFA